MQISINKKAVVIAVALAAAIGCTAAVGVSAIEKPSYSTNSSGISFGKVGAALTPADEPDLIGVVGNGGKEGYSYKTALDDPKFTSPKEALAWQATVLGTTRTIPVFTSDGKTQIDTFTISYPYPVESPK